ncbi:MAG: aminotransferase class V-fold PLP-dependent enzyme, partial [Elusimicrobiales bacterium]|nr:aminotransferase class V-fold PLP-dependent enzyme [Elusimicrobiales bacterium]
MNKSLAALNKEFPVLKARFAGRRLVYLDSACTVLKMRRAADAQRANLLRLGGCGGRRSFYSLSAGMEEEFEAARRTVADFMGAASPDEIIFAGGVTDAANLLANSFHFTRDRSEVVLSPLEHNAVFLPFERLAAAGRVKLKVLPLKG